MKSLLADESADSAIPLVIVLAVLSFGLFYIIFSISFDVPIQSMNDLISEGMVTENTAHYFELCLNMWKTAPWFALIGLTLWCVERSKGGEIGIWTYFSYQSLMIIGIIISCFMVYCYGIAMDGITMAMDEVPMLTTDLAAGWDSSSARAIVIAAMYYVCLMPAYLTSILFMIHPIIIQKFMNQQVYRESDATDINFQQF